VGSRVLFETADLDVDTRALRLSACKVHDTPRRSLQSAVPLTKLEDLSTLQ
jgi:hypothetical protein